MSMATSYVGIDIGSGSVKLALRDPHFRLITRRLPDNTVAEGNIVSPEVMADILKKAREEENIKQKDCVLMISPSQLYFRQITMPPMTVDELEINLPFEFRDFIDGDPADYVFDYAVDHLDYDESGNVVSMQLYAAAAERDMIEQRAEILRKAGFRLRIASPSLLTYAHLLENHIKTHPEDADRDVALINIGYNDVTISLYKGSRFDSIRSISFGCRDIDLAIAELKGIDPHVAGTYKHSNFEGVLDTPEAQAVYDRLDFEVIKVINFYNFSNPDGDIAAIYLLGGGSEIEQLVSSMRESIDDIPIYSIDDLLPADVVGNEDSAACALAIAGMIAGEMV